MRKTTVRLLILFTSLYLISCEKVIEVDLNEKNPLLVIEGGLTSRNSPDTIKLSRTGSYFGNGVFQMVTGANVFVSDDIGNTELLKEVEAGTYVTQNFKGQPGRTFHLKVEADSKTYTASSTMLHPVEIDYMTYRWKERSLGTREGNYVTIYFRDPEEGNNYYMIKAKGTTVSYNNGSDQFFVISDEYFNGGFAVIEIPYIHFGKGVAEIELFSIDKNAFNYYTSLNEIILNPGPSPFSGVPQNSAKSNIKGDAVGYFQVFSVSQRSLSINLD